MSPAATPAPAPQPVTPDLQPAAKRQKLTAAARGLQLALTSSAPCRVSITISVDRATAKRLGTTTTLARSVANLSAGTANVRVRFKTPVANALKRARKPVKLKITIDGPVARTLTLTLTK